MLMLLMIFFRQLCQRLPRHATRCHAAFRHVAYHAYCWRCRHKPLFCYAITPICHTAFSYRRYADYAFCYYCFTNIAVSLKRAVYDAMMLLMFVFAYCRH